MTEQIHLAAHFPGANNTIVWSDPRSGSQIDFGSFRHLAETAERGRFDFFFLAEGLRLREMKGRIHDLDVMGRPESLTVLAALSAVTSRLGLAATVNSTFNEPYEVARRLATLDHLTADPVRGEFLREGGVTPFRHAGRHFDIQGLFNVPRGPQGHPVIIQAGDSDEGREFAASSADVIFSRHGRPEEARTFYRDVKRRLAAYGRRPADLKIMPAVTYVLGDTGAEAAERARRGSWTGC